MLTPVSLTPDGDCHMVRGKIKLKLAIPVKAQMEDER
jgi:hypothetical protein